MSKILYEYTKINGDLISIIRSYLCIKKQINISKLINKIECINLILDKKHCYLNINGIITHYKIDDCKVKYNKHFNRWTIRPKNYHS